jgi:hypothetical protein
MSVPPPSAPLPSATSAAEELVDRRREIVLELEGPRGWRNLSTREAGFIRLLGSEVTFVRPGVLLDPLTIPGGLIKIAAVDRGRSDADHGRFVVLRRLPSNAVVPREQGIDGWLWTSRQGSGIPTLSEGAEDVPNLALMFTKPLAEDVVTRHFSPDYVKALAERSPLGKPSILGLLCVVAQPWTAEEAFRQFGVMVPLTDREVPPTMRRHLPDDKPASPTLIRSDESRAATSVAPPGF